MYQPETYAIALSFMAVSMLCWGSWANTVKLCPGYRFQLFYWDYVIGLILGSLLWGLTLGSAGETGRSFLSDVAHASGYHIWFAALGGIIFNVANLLLVAAIDIAGLAVAFPIGIGLALVVGAVSSYHDSRPIFLAQYRQPYLDRKKSLQSVQGEPSPRPLPGS